MWQLSSVRNRSLPGSAFEEHSIALGVLLRKSNTSEHRRKRVAGSRDCVHFGLHVSARRVWIGTGNFFAASSDTVPVSNSRYQWY